MKMPQVKLDTVVMRGGTDQVTPTLALSNGFCRQSTNFEAAKNDGYTRVVGYERFDGRTSPSSPTPTSTMISVSAYTNTLSVGDTITGDTSSATAVVSMIVGLRIGITKISGTFEIEGISVGATAIGIIDNLSAGPTTTKESVELINAAADIYRADITAVPGSGSILGVTLLNDIVYAFRNNAGGTAVDIYKSSSSGWVNVPLFREVSFTAGGASTPAEGATITQGAVTATIKRVVLEGGEFSGSNAVGRFIVSSVVGGAGAFVAGAATIGATNVTLSGADTAITIAVGGRYETIKTNFFGEPGTARIYGCDGVNRGFEFDGTVYVPIATTLSGDNPSHVVRHGPYLFFSVGTTYTHSVSFEPYNFDTGEGAGSNPTGDTITGFLVLSGDSSSSTLLIYNRSDRGILYGNTPADFKFVKYNIGAGAVKYTAQNMAQAMGFDDRGLEQVSAAQEFGNFTSTTITNLVQPFINSHTNTVTASVVNRTKSQYRLFYSNGDGLYVTIVNGKIKGCMPVYYPDPVLCTVEGKLSTGAGVSFFGSSDGFVYQFDSGTSHDGDPIEYNIEMNYSSARNSRILKRFRRASLELSSENPSYVELDVGYQLGYGLTSYVQQNGESYTAYLAQSTWDSFIWDSFFWDSLGTAPLELNVIGTAENIAFSFYGKSDYVESFTINSLMIHYTDRRIMR